VLAARRARRSKKVHVVASLSTSPLVERGIQEACSYGTDILLNQPDSPR
jgi:hypothetical protein